ncbi:hypothetical protein [Streptomyces chrestomyceticus]|uniref:hypothetical protein n=1 Tax=Streptomyces chrestomyceticus TaxID=68185 RepID=UPI00340DD8FB
MAFLCYSNLEDGRVAVSTLDGVHGALRDWVFSLLADVTIHDRPSRPVERFTASLGERGVEGEGIALEAIRLIRYAQEQLLYRNAYIRYLCPDCPREGSSSCHGGRRPFPSLRTTRTPDVRFAGARVRAMSPLPAASNVLERLQLMASTIEQSPVSEEHTSARAGFLANLRRLANQWRARGIDDSAVDIEEPNPQIFYGQVALTLSRARNVEQERTDARHSPVNFIAAVLKTLASKLATQPRAVAREPVMAALVARNAAIEGDAATVDEFTSSWLGLGMPEMWREAVEAALLGDWVDMLGVCLSQDAEVMDLLKRHTRAEHLHLQPIWERKARGHRLRMLEDPVSEGLTLRDIVTDRRLLEDSVLGRLEDDRVSAVLRSLTPGEKGVAEVYGASRMTWSQAAEAAGVDDPAAFGERVRTKLKRLGKRHRARVATAVRSTTAAVH